MADAFDNEYDVFCEQGVTAPLSDERIAEVLDAVLLAEGAGRPCMVSVSVVGEERIRELNAEWRGVDRATDVISLECERPDDPSLAPGEPCELGDIVLAPAFIAAQATRFGTTEADEFTLMLVHGAMHLLGWDHLDEEAASAMEAREEELLALVGTERPIGRVTLTLHREEDDA